MDETGAYYTDWSDLAAAAAVCGKQNRRQHNTKYQKKPNAMWNIKREYCKHANDYLSEFEPPWINKSFRDRNTLVYILKTRLQACVSNYPHGLWVVTVFLKIIYCNLLYKTSLRTYFYLC